MSRVICVGCLFFFVVTSKLLGQGCGTSDLGAVFTGFQCHDFTALGPTSIDSRYVVRSIVRDEDGNVLRDERRGSGAWGNRISSGLGSVSAAVNLDPLNFANSSGAIFSNDQPGMLSGLEGSQLVTGGVGLSEGGSYVLASAYAYQEASATIGGVQQALSTQLLSKRIRVALRIKNDGGPVRGNVRDPFIVNLENTQTGFVSTVNLFETSLEVDSSALLDELPGVFDFTINPGVEWITGFDQAPTLKVILDDLTVPGEVSVGVNGYWELDLGDRNVPPILQTNGTGSLRFDIVNGNISLNPSVASGVFAGVQATGAGGSYEIDLSTALAGMLDIDPVTGEGLVKLDFASQDPNLRAVSSQFTMESISERYINPTGQMFSLNRADFPESALIPISGSLVGGALLAGDPLASGGKFVIDPGGPSPPTLLRTAGSDAPYDAELVMTSDETSHGNQIYFNSRVQAEQELSVLFDFEFGPNNTSPGRSSNDEPTGLELKLLPGLICGQTGIPLDQDCLGWFANHPTNVPILGLRLNADYDEATILNADGQEHVFPSPFRLEGKFTALLRVEGDQASWWLRDEFGNLELLAEGINVGGAIANQELRGAFSASGGRHTAIDNFVMTTSIPEPSSLALLTFGIVAVAFRREARIQK